MATYDDWTPELQRFSQRAQRGTNEMTDGLLALAAELAELRKVLTPVNITTTLESTPAFGPILIGQDRLARYVGAIEERLSELRTDDERVPADPLVQKLDSLENEDQRSIGELTTEAVHAVLNQVAVLRCVGWYCPGGHRGEDGQPVPTNLRFDDPCLHSVPVYVLVKS